MIREYKPSDLAALKKLHAGLGYDCELPDMSSPLVIGCKLIEQGGELQSALIGKVTCEAYFLDSKAGTPKERWARFAALHDAAVEAGREAGMDEVGTYLIPEVERAQTKRMLKLGWWHNPWYRMTKEL